MARCETCGGPVRERLAPTHGCDPHLTISAWDFCEEMGRTRAYKTVFCSAECAIKGIEEDNLRTLDSSMFWCDRHGYDPTEIPDPPVGPMIERAYELLAKAQGFVDEDDEVWDLLQGAAGRAESAQALVDGPEVTLDGQ